MIDEKDAEKAVSSYIEAHKLVMGMLAKDEGAKGPASTYARYMLENNQELLEEHPIETLMHAFIAGMAHAIVMSAANEGTENVQ